MPIGWEQLLVDAAVIGGHARWARRLRGLQAELKPRQTLTAEIVSADGALQRVPLLCRIDTLDELDYYNNGGILHYVLRKLAA